MTPLPTLSQVLHETSDRVKKDYRLLFPVSIGGSLLSFLLVLLFFGILDWGFDADAATSPFTNLSTILLLFAVIAVLAFTVSVFTTVVLIEILAHDSERERYTLSQAVYHGMERFWPMVALSIVLTILFIVASLLGDLLAGVLGLIFSLFSVSLVDAGVFLGDIIAIIITVVVGVWLIFAPYFLVAEKSSVIDSVKNSFLLVKGRWWAFFLRIVLLYAAIFGFGVLIRFIPYVGGPIAAFFGPLLLATYLYVIFQNSK